MIQFVGINASDTLQRGERFRLTYSRGTSLNRIGNFFNPLSSASFAKVWETMTQVTRSLAIPISPKPSDTGPTAVIDVKVGAGAPSMSVGAFADRLNTITDATYLDRLQLLDATGLSLAVAPDARTREATRAADQRKRDDPLGAPLGKFFAGLKAVTLGLLVTGVVVGGVILYLRFGRKPRRRAWRWSPFWPLRSRGSTRC